jgi:hypothetical protein
MDSRLDRFTDENRDSRGNQEIELIEQTDLEMKEKAQTKLPEVCNFRHEHSAYKSNSLFPTYLATFKKISPNE